VSEVHAADCAPCDAARAVVAALREDFDPLENWDEVELEGASVTDRTIARVAEVLHRYPIPGGNRPQRSKK
jgi:hypothetical protein